VLVRRPSVRWATGFGTLGGAVPLGFLGLLHIGAGRWGLRTHFIVQQAAEVVWPSSFWLLATSGSEDTLEGWSIVAMSIAANMLLYAFIGAMISTLRPKPRAAGPPPAKADLVA
jgi:hypothetical protein